MHALPEAFLFDFDGVLVQSEEVHCEAYRRMAAARGERLDWTFERYCLAAHYGPQQLQRELRAEIPGLFAGGVTWEELYGEKSKLYLELLREEKVVLQPGAESVLQRLGERGAAHAVVTNSTRAQTLLLRQQFPVLDAVPLWLTREDYTRAKPDPDAYLTALARLGCAAERCIGFEDTPRGLQALAGAGVPAVLVSAIPYPDLAGVTPVVRGGSLAELPPELFG